jgi:hypothetical protein
LIEWDLDAIYVSGFESHLIASDYWTLASCTEIIVQLSTLQTEIEYDRHCYCYPCLLDPIPAGILPFL